MPLLRPLAALACLFPAMLTAQSVLFVGNSFTFMPRTKNVGVVENLNPGYSSGVPAAFQAIAAAAGKTPRVSMETVGGKNLEFHFSKRRALIGKPWDIVVLQDYSTGPLVPKDGSTKSRDSFLANLKNLRDLLVAQNPAVKIWLYETWARPDVVEKGLFPSMESMQAGLHQAYGQAAKDDSLQGWVPVGDSFLAAVKDGLADNPVTPAVEGPLKIWGPDNHHQSALGTYLAALLFYGKIYDADPRALPADNPAATRLKITPADSHTLQSVAWRQLQAAP